jgi:hypothetical protein
LEGSSLEHPAYDTVHLVVPPGWAPSNVYTEFESGHKGWDEPERMTEFLKRFYSDYLDDLGSALDKAVKSGEPVHVLYDSEESLSHIDLLLETYTEEEFEPASYTRTIQNDGDVKPSNAGEVLKSVENLGEDGTVVVHGEINGRCPNNLDFIEQATSNDLLKEDLAEGWQFPPEPTWNYVFAELK